jgi:hypothetical protein
MHDFRDRIQEEPEQRCLSRIADRSGGSGFGWRELRVLENRTGKER